MICSNIFLLMFFKRKFSSSCYDKCFLSSFFVILVFLTCASNFSMWSLRWEISLSFPLLPCNAYQQDLYILVVMLFCFVKVWLFCLSLDFLAAICSIPSENFKMITKHAEINNTENFRMHPYKPEISANPQIGKVLLIISVFPQISWKKCTWSCTRQATSTRWWVEESPMTAITNSFRKLLCCSKATLFPDFASWFSHSRVPKNF